MQGSTQDLAGQTAPGQDRLERTTRSRRARDARAISMRTLIIVFVVAFALGAALIVWLGYREGWIPPTNIDAPASGGATNAAEMRAAATDANSGAAQDRPDDGSRDAIAMRIDELERRLSRIDLRAEAASGNAARAEGILIAFAARRLLERGAPLGYLENQLQLRFGNAQPNAVRTLLGAARDPVTLEDLRAELEAISEEAIRSADLTGWERLLAEISQLFVIRRADAPSPQPQRRLERARELLANGRVAAAAREVSRLPGEEATAAWLARARRYVAVQNALELIETAAILEPRALQDASGQPVRQRSPAAAPSDAAKPAPAPSPAAASPSPQGQ